MIDREKVIKGLEEIRECCECQRYEYGENVIDAAIAMLKVQEPRAMHSRWKCTDAYPHWLYCMNCYKRIVPNVDWVEEYNIPTKYCPNCGAKMDEIAEREPDPD